MLGAKTVREEAVRNTKTGIILDAALRVFSKRGYHDTRLDDIAVEAGFSKAALYNYYKDKEAIFLSLAIREYEHLVGRLEEEVDLAGPLEENLGRIVRTIFSLLGRHLAILLTISHFRMYNLLNSHSLDGARDGRIEQFGYLYKKMSDLIAACISAAREHGAVHSDFPVEALAGYVLALVKETCCDWQIAGRMGDIDKETGKIVAFLMRGMEAS